MKKTLKRVISIVCVVAMMAVCAIPAFAATDAAIFAARRGRTAFAFTIENRGDLRILRILQKRQMVYMHGSL